MPLPTTTDEWVVDSPSKDLSTFHIRTSVPLEQVGPDDVLLDIKAVSLNYRDIAIARGEYPLPTRYPLVPVCDTAGTILAIGSSVSSLAVGDAVVIIPVPFLQKGHLTIATDATLGDGKMPGALRQHIVIPASWVARFPSHLSFAEASTLGGAGVTAWNTLFGVSSQSIGPGAWVVTQGTGAVSMFAAAFAVKAGANVVATTSSADKKNYLEELGVHTVINYREDPGWGETAKALTPDQEGVDLVVDIGGPGTLGQSLKALRYEGTAAVVGYLAEGTDTTPSPSVMEVLGRALVVRGIRAGSREHYEQMAEKIQEWQFHPVVDKRVFKFDEAKEAYEYLWQQKHIGKVVIEM